MDSQTRFILFLSVLLFICVVFFFLTGMIQVKEGFVVILSSHGRFKKTLAKGHYYFQPLLYQASNPLPLAFVKKTIRMDKNNILSFSWRLVDPEKFYDSHLQMKGVLRDLYSESQQNPHLIQEMSQVMDNLGLAITDVKIIGR